MVKIFILILLAGFSFQSWTPVKILGSHSDCTSIKDAVRDDAEHLHVLYSVPRPWTLYYIKLDRYHNVIVNYTMPVKNAEFGVISRSKASLFVAILADHAIWYIESNDNGWNWNDPVRVHKDEFLQVERSEPAILAVKETGRVFIFYNRHKLSTVFNDMVMVTKPFGSDFFSAEKIISPKESTVFSAVYTFPKNNDIPRIHFFASIVQNGEHNIEYSTSDNLGLTWRNLGFVAGKYVDTGYRFIAHAASNLTGHIFLQYNSYSENPNENARIRFKYSKDHGATWSNEFTSVYKMDETYGPWVQKGSMEVFTKGSANFAISFVESDDRTYNFTRWTYPDMNEANIDDPFDNCQSWGAIARSIKYYDKLITDVIVSNNTEWCTSSDIIMASYTHFDD